VNTTLENPQAHEAVQLATDYQAGSLHDFDRLYRDSHDRLLRTLVGILHDLPAAEDCVQEAFVRALRAWPRWRAEVPAEAWLHRIALTVALSHRRRERFQALSQTVRHFGRSSEPTLPDDGAWSSGLLAALRRIPPHDAAIIVLRFSHGYTNREIAVALGVAEDHILSRLAAAKDRLHAELARNTPTDEAESQVRATDAFYRQGHERFV
jgi:RNA polymerase sigma factor (sigma-70 family)